MPSESPERTDAGPACSPTVRSAWRSPPSPRSARWWISSSPLRRSIASSTCATAGRRSTSAITGTTRGRATVGGRPRRGDLTVAPEVATRDELGRMAESPAQSGWAPRSRRGATTAAELCPSIGSPPTDPVRRAIRCAAAPFQFQRVGSAPCRHPEGGRQQFLGGRNDTPQFATAQLCGAAPCLPAPDRVLGHSSSRHTPEPAPCPHPASSRDFAT